MTSHPKRRDGIMSREVGDERMLYDAAGRAVHVLNGSAEWIWDHCDGTHTIEEIIAEAVELFGADEAEIRTDVDECLATFTERNLLID